MKRLWALTAEQEGVYQVLRTDILQPLRPGRPPLPVLLHGVTGSGKTFTMAQTLAQLDRPVLVISHNKTLAAQLYEEFKELFPENPYGERMIMLPASPFSSNLPGSTHAGVPRIWISGSLRQERRMRVGPA